MRSFKSTTTRVWAINKIDHAPELPFARGVGSVRTRDKEPSRGIDEKKASREDEESLVRMNRHKGTNICLRSVLQREGVTVLFSFPKIPSMSEEREGVSGRPVDMTSVKLTRLPATSTKIYVRRMKLMSWKIA